MRSKIYKWHRTFSLIISIPVLLWASSGFMHPVMTNIRPKIATQGLPSVAIDSARIHVPLQAALRLHHLDSIADFRMVHIDTNWFYQVQLPASRLPNAHGTTNGPGIKSSGIAGSPVPLPGGLPAAAAAATIPIYLSCTNGNVLPAGDWLYAQYLARQFLEGPATLPASTSSGASFDHQSASTSHDHLPAVTETRRPGAPAPNARPGHGGMESLTPSSPAPIAIAYTAPIVHDCCGAATETVLNPVKGAKVANVSLLKNYDLEYKSINKLLPVYRVSFDRPDGIRVYVETTRDRFAFAMDNRRMVFDRVFTLVHTWAWLEFLGKGKLAVEGGLASMAFLTALMGIYIFFTTKSKKANGNGLVRARRTHRYTSIIIALFTLMFTFSGAFHAFSKFREDTRDRFFVAPSFATADLDFRFSKLQEVVKEPITDVSIVSMYGHSYWQVTQGPASSRRTSTPSSPAQPASRQSASAAQPAAAPSSIQPSSKEPMASTATHGRDLMKDAQAPTPSIVYLQTDSPYSALPQGEMRYAGFLACTFSGQPASAIRTSDPVLRFTSEYNFADKRLPVWKISYASNNNQRYYVETSTGRLSKHVTDNSLVEEYSFAFLHKHEFMGWGGKTVKDISTMFWAMAQIVLVTIGLMLYVKYRKRSSPARHIS